jgi:hypothetical protein
MTGQDFATQYRLTTKKDSCGEVIIAGRPRNAAHAEDRSHIFEYGSGKFGVCLLMGTAGKWNNRKKAALGAGFALGQDGDTEGTLLFDPQDAKQARLAIKLVGAREKRRVTPEQLNRLSKVGFKASQHTVEGPSGV